MIYLIQPEELVGLNRYKIGFSGASNLYNISKKYGKKARYLAVMECYDAESLVREIKEILADQFTVITNTDCFSGDEDKIVKTFTESVNEFIHNTDDCCGDCDDDDCDDSEGDCGGNCDDNSCTESEIDTEFVCNNCTVGIIEEFEGQVESLGEQLNKLTDCYASSESQTKITLAEISKELKNIKSATEMNADLIKVLYQKLK